MYKLALLFIFLSIQSFTFYGQSVEIIYELTSDGTELEKSLNKIDKSTLSTSQKVFLEKMVDDDRTTKHIFYLYWSGGRSSYLFKASERAENAAPTTIQNTFIDYYKDANSGKYIGISSMMRANEQVEGSLLTIKDWTIDNTIKKVICGYETTKAVHKDGKRVAWFTTKIPISEGPEQYSGLPGIILMLESLHVGKTITAKTVTQKVTSTVIALPNREKKLTFEQYKGKLSSQN